MLEEAFKGIGYGIEEGKVYEREQKRRQTIVCVSRWYDSRQRICGMVVGLETTLQTKSVENCRKGEQRGSGVLLEPWTRYCSQGS